MINRIILGECLLLSNLLDKAWRMHVEWLGRATRVLKAESGRFDIKRNKTVFYLSVYLVVHSLDWHINQFLRATPHYFDED